MIDFACQSQLKLYGAGKDCYPQDMHSDIRSSAARGRARGVIVVAYAKMCRDVKGIAEFRCQYQMYQDAYMLHESP